MGSCKQVPLNHRCLWANWSDSLCSQKQALFFVVWLTLRLTARTGEMTSSLKRLTYTKGLQRPERLTQIQPSKITWEEFTCVAYAICTYVYTLGIHHQRTRILAPLSFRDANTSTCMKTLQRPTKAVSFQSVYSNLRSKNLTGDYNCKITISDTVA